jgi:ATP-binding cassette subfamily F protein 3
LSGFLPESKGTMSLISLQQVAISFGAEDVLDGISGEVNAGDRIGLIGRNGVGKTTLLRIMAGTVRPLSGARHISRGVRVVLVEQLPPQSDAALTVRLETLSAFSETIELHSALEDAAEAMAAGDDDAALIYTSLLHRLEEEGGFNYEQRMKQVLTGLGFRETDWERPVSTLSGGQRSRLALARALLAQPDVLLMDEPTNHLDIEGLRWLEGFLSRWTGTLVVTSHDRYFLDKVPTRIWHLEQHGIKAYPGNYSKFEELYKAERDLLQKRYEAQQAFITREQEFIRRYGAGQRAGEARGRQRRLERLLGTEHNASRHEGRALFTAPARARDASFRFRAGRTGDLVLSTAHLAVGHGGSPVLNVPDLEVVRGDRIALIGPNGAGKSTLLKMIAGELSPIEGRLRVGSGVSFGHYWQEAEDLRPTASVLDEIVRNATITFQEARDILGRFLFSGDDVSKLVSVLSGGERSRLALARLVNSEASVLLLDEPTNHLDISSREVLEAALETFTGTLLIASHDRRLISRLASSLWLIADGHLTVFQGTLDDYEAVRSAGEVDVPASPKPQAIERPEVSKNTIRRREAAVAGLEQRIEAMEHLLVELTDEIKAASDRTDVAALTSLGTRYAEVTSLLDGLIKEWSDLQQ